jgi:hypothetical protein
MRGGATTPHADLFDAGRLPQGWTATGAALLAASVERRLTLSFFGSPVRKYATAPRQREITEPAH